MAWEQAPAGAAKSTAGSSSMQTSLSASASHTHILYYSFPPAAWGGAESHRKLGGAEGPSVEHHAVRGFFWQAGLIPNYAAAFRAGLCQVWCADAGDFLVACIPLCSHDMHIKATGIVRCSLAVSNEDRPNQWLTAMFKAPLLTSTYTGSRMKECSDVQVLQ